MCADYDGLVKTAVTIEFDDDVLAKAEAEAARRRTTLSSVLEDLIRDRFQEPRPVKPGKYYLPVFRPDVGGRPEGITDDISFAEMMDILDDAESNDPA